MKAFVKDPDAVLDYGFDWTEWLDGDTISNSIWIVESGLTVVPGSETADDNFTKLFISGGVNDANYTLTNRITTAGQRTADRSMQIKVRSR